MHTAGASLMCATHVVIELLHFSTADTQDELTCSLGPEHDVLSGLS